MFAYTDVGNAQLVTVYAVNRNENLEIICMYKGRKHGKLETVYAPETDHLGGCHSGSYTVTGYAKILHGYGLGNAEILFRKCGDKPRIRHEYGPGNAHFRPVD